ncbi:MAG: aminotransferase class V-fold PLP-dependent enzyme [Thermoleophilia bacterium]|nr:aminotransferase class V-fold PLP-dependent enzyme [Thermoleophilia bacterium]
MTAPALPFDADEVEAIRAELPAATGGGAAYLNAGTLGPMPQVAIEAMAAAAARDASARQWPELWEELGAAQGAAREAVAALTGVVPEQAALMHSTHEGMNVALWGLDASAGDNVVTTSEEHPGLLVPLRHLRDRAGLEVRQATWGDDDEAFVDAVLAQVDARTRAVALSHVSWQSGRVAPLRALRDALGDRVRLVVDGAQSAGVLVLDPADGWDAYSVSGQKWPLGPNGSGGLALVDPEAWRPTFGAYLQVADPADCLGSPLATDGRRFETSQEALGPLVGFAASVGWLTRRVGIDRASAHAAHLNASVREVLVGGGVPADALHGEGHLLAVDVPGDAAVEVTMGLHGAGFAVRPLGSTRVRISFGCWNTTAEATGCAEALARLLTD